MRTRILALAAAGALGLVLADPAASATFRMSASGDANTMDPHANNAGNTTLVLRQIYEPLITRGKALEKIPALATEWKATSPTTWSIKIRQNVRFHGGEALTADDAVFSLKRAMAPTSDYKAYMTGVKDVIKTGDFEIQIVTDAPLPILPDQLTSVRIMSKSWSEKNKVEAPQNFRQKEETFAVRNANGTGPFMLRTREPDARTVMARNPNYYLPIESNVTEIVFTPVGNDATRTSALLSGELDFVLDPPTQNLDALRRDQRIKVVDGAENRTIFLAFDQKRDELLYSNVKGKNPLKDRRVREAMYRAIDIEAIKSRIMRGQAVTTGSMWSEFVVGYTKENDARLPLDRDMAKKLLTEAGYANGFELGMDCPNNRYVNDEQICLAVAQMLAQIGINVKLNLMPMANFLPKLQKEDTSFYLLGWGVPTFDALYTLQSLIRTKGEGADGSFNYGNYSNAKVDALIDKIKVEVDVEKRTGYIVEALKLQNQDIGHIPLHHQMIPWAMKSGVSVVHSAENQLEVRWVKVN